MRKTILAMVGLLVVCSAFGCGEKKEEAGNISTTAPVDNNAPEAKNAPVAPRDPSIIMPGGGGKGKKMPGGPG